MGMTMTQKILAAHAGLDLLVQDSSLRQIWICTWK